tara:strand:- start:632 stop:952 length:321 start_codon:yes stop_codon:yes gene_type:complete
MNKYRVLKPYPKQITNSGRLITLKKGKQVYLKKEGQVLRLVKMGFLKPIVELPKKQAKPKKKPAVKESKPMEMKPMPEISEEEDSKEDNRSKSRRKSKSDYLNKKK